METNALIEELAKNLNIKASQIEAVLKLLAEDATVPFIARYRKEVTGGLNEEQIRLIDEDYRYQVNLAKRKEDVIRLIAEKDLLTKELEEAILNAPKLIDVEDLYRPFKEKKKTKATEAIKNGLEPLAKLMLENNYFKNKEELVAPFINENIKTYDDAVTNAKYIIAEIVSDNADYRKFIRENSLTYGKIQSKIKKNAIDEKERFKLYYDKLISLKYIKPHQVLAINRGEDLNILTVNIILNDEYYVNYILNKLISNRHILFREEVIDAVNDSFKRLILPSVSREIRSILTEIADKQAIDVFSFNVKNLLLQPPLKGKTILGVDPAYRTGCKLAVVDNTGKFIAKDVIYPNEKHVGDVVNEATIIKSEKTVVNLCNKYNVSIIAIGNGTASRETETFIANTIKKYNLNSKYVIVSEAGASVYSASELAKEEFPTLEVQERSAISIARRIQDPLAELVKIDPKSIGVGQYQHDVNQKELALSLDNVVGDVVNNIGVNVNTASVSLLRYVSGLTKKQAQNIIDYRETNGAIPSREVIGKIKGIGPKTYEQAIGFLRINEPKNKLDMTSIHPESYDKALNLLKYIDLSLDDIGTKEIKEKINNLNKDEVINKLNIDKYTLDDICSSFIQPIRDIRDEYPQVELRSDILHFEDIKIGDMLNGTVRNVVDFGVFVDCGVKHDGLLHISKLGQKVEHPSDILAIGDFVKVEVVDINYTTEKMQLALIK